MISLSIQSGSVKQLKNYWGDVMKTERVLQTSTSTVNLLGLLFIGLKLTGHIDWSWWLILAPFWIPFAIALLVVFVGLSYLLVYFLKSSLQ